MVSCSPTLATCTSMESSIKDSDKGPVIHFCIKLEVPISELLQAIEQFREQMTRRGKAQEINARLHEEIHAKAILMDQVKLQESRRAAEEFQAPVCSDWHWEPQWCDDWTLHIGPNLNGWIYQLESFARFKVASFWRRCFKNNPTSRYQEKRIWPEFGRELESMCYQRIQSRAKDDVHRIP